MDVDFGDCFGMEQSFFSRFSFDCLRLLGNRKKTFFIRINVAFYSNHQLSM